MKSRIVQVILALLSLLFLANTAKADDSMFDMLTFPPRVLVKQQKSTPQVAKETTIYIGKDKKGVSWRASSEKELEFILNEQNAVSREEECKDGTCPVPVKKKQSVTINFIPSAPKKVYGQDRFGRWWMADDHVQLKTSIDRANQTVTQYYYSQSVQSFPQYSVGAVRSGGG